MTALCHPAAPVQPLRGRPLVRRWIAVTTAGEIAGFTVPAVAGALTATLHMGAVLTVASLVVAGAVEGAVLGVSQALVVRHAVPSVPSRAWIGATAAGAALSYAIALVPSAAGGRLGELPRIVLVTGGAVLGVAFLVALGGLPARVLRGRLERAWRWVPVTAGAWTAGLVVFTAIAPPLWHDGQPVVQIVLIGLLAGCAMALTVAAVTGTGLARLVAEP